MSTKTLRKRIALVAVSALTAGLVSVAPAANAANDGLITDFGGIGLLGTPVTAIDLAQTASYLTSGTIVLETGDGAFKIASGSASIIGRYTTGTIAAPATPTFAGIDADAQGAETNDGDFLAIRPTGAAGSTIVVKGYTGAGVIISRVTITLAASSVAGVPSASKSEITWVTANGDTPADEGVDDVGASSNPTGDPLFMNIALKDAYGAAIEDGGALVVTVTAGATVAIGGLTGGHGDAILDADKGTYTTAVSALSPADINVRVDEKTAGAGWNGTVTVTFNGTAIATKSGKITGAVASLVVTPKLVATTAANTWSEESFTFIAKDSAGNALAQADSSEWTLISSSGDIISAAEGMGDNSGTSTNGYAYDGQVKCADGGSTDVVIGGYVGGELVKSNTFKMNCGGAAASYTASFDKAVYAQGDLATLTVVFKDADGNLANSYDEVSAHAEADQSITHPMLEHVGSYKIDELVGVAGSVAHKYTVGTITFAPGKFNATVTYPTVATGSTQTVGYEVTSSVGGVSNADVLKAIVSLIASINKQIAALQKALLKKK